MSVEYRTGGEKDIADAAVLFGVAMTDMLARNGITVPRPDPASIEPWYRHLREHGIFEVAVDGETLVAFAAGIVRDGQFFLSMFWTEPSRQRRGIGKPLLLRVWDEAERAGATVFHVWSSIDFAALGIYLKLGMRPVGPILTFGGAPKAIDDAPPVELAPLDPAIVSNIDQAVRGTGRAVDHAFFARQKKHAHLVCRGAQTLGYFYADEGRIGPAAWLDERDGRALLAAALPVALSTASDGVTLSIPGPNRVAIDVAVDAGLTLRGTSHYLTSAPFGAIDRYVPSGPALF